MLKGYLFANIRIRVRKKMDEHGHSSGLYDAESVRLLTRGDVGEGPCCLKDNLFLDAWGRIELTGEEKYEAGHDVAVNDILDRRILLLGQHLRKRVMLSRTSL